MGARVNYSGLVVAGVGFVLTRFTVTLAIYESPVRFYVGGVVPMALGLGLAAFGVALTVADVDASLARTTALWCCVGVGGMLTLTVLTLVGTTGGGVPDFATVRSRTYLSNYLIGGSVGGTLTGLYAARNRRQRGELRRQRNRLEVINRMLRHEVLNAVTVIRGYATTRGEGLDGEAVIEERSTAIERTVEEVKHVARRTGDAPAGGAVDLGACLEASVEAVRESHPDVDVSVGPVPSDLTVRADERLPRVVTHLLENAVVHARDDSPAVDVTATGSRVRISVTDDGPGLPERQRTLLETGDIEEFDDPRTGFGLNLVRLLVEGYGGTIETAVEGTGTTVSVVLARGRSETAGVRPSQSELAGVRPAVPHLLVTLVAAVVAGVPYGIVSEHLGGSVAGIGVFYGAADPVVGWLTHEFHSVVFGFVFVGLVSLAPERYRSDAVAYVVIGVAWSLVLWAVAASVVAPLWLQLLGIPVPVPNVSLRLLASHLVWGVFLAVLTVLGYGFVTEREASAP
jgi:signal transduction histidine kinase